jgi:hypothetical protein
MSVTPLAETHASAMPATRLLGLNRKSVAPWRRPVTRTAYSPSEQKLPKPGTSGGRRMGIPAAKPKRFFPFTL